MTRQTSFSKIRNDMMHGFREKMHQAESTEDVKKFYAETMHAIFNRLVGKDDPVRIDEVALSPSSPDGYVLTETLRARPLFQSAWDESDLPFIVDDFTKMALNRHAHMKKNPEKTRSKIRHTGGKR